ncbi:MAG: hypothetical protein ACLUAR_17050 [Pilosibacter sp.]
MTDDGRSYLYMELSSENDWKTMGVYDLNGERRWREAGSSIDSVKLGAPIRTPDAFYLTRRIDALRNATVRTGNSVWERTVCRRRTEMCIQRSALPIPMKTEMPLVSTRALPVTLFRS